VRVLHVIDSGGLYGAEVMLLDLVGGQTRVGMKPSILSIGDIGIGEKPLETEAWKRGYKVWSVRMRRGPNFVGALKIVAAARRDAVDIMHSHGYKSNILFGFMPGPVRGIPIVSTLHGWTSTDRISKLKAYEWLDAQSLRFVDAVVLVSRGMLANQKLGHLNPKRVHFVNNGIPIHDDQPAQITQGTQVTLDQRIVSFCQQGFTIGSIGRLSAEKGYVYLIEAFGSLIRNGIDGRLVIIGEGDERKKLEDLATHLGLSDRVMLPGYRKDAKNYLPCFNVFVLPSLTEGLPITILEAMNVGIPIVATGVGGVPEVLGFGKGGILVDKCNAGEMAEGILKAYREPELSRSLGEWNQREVRKRYSSEQMVAQYSELYKAVIRDLG
jgi:glycosyltransferase involved in cell wall biosynthesis